MPIGTAESTLENWMGLGPQTPFGIEFNTTHTSVCDHLIYAPLEDKPLNLCPASTVYASTLAYMNVLPVA